MIAKLRVANFQAFSELTIDFSPGINIVIGENGTGKTQLLKAAYTLSSGSDFFRVNSEPRKEEVSSFFSNKLLRIFMPLDDKLGKMHRAGSSEKAELEADFSLEKNIHVSFHNNSQSVAIQNNENYQAHTKAPVFIPTKEVLSFMKGFNSLYERYELSFDQTYQDICLSLDLPELRPDKIQPKAKWAMTEIENICEGKFVFYGGGKVIFKSKENSEYSANAMAEGFRKVGMLSRLIETGAIQPGVSGALFWDEPESNLNPKLMRLLVEILLELSRNGQQIVIATHDYVLLKWFDLLASRELGDYVLFHTLYRDTDTNELEVETVDNYLAMRPNAITSTYSELYDSEIERALGSAN